MDSDDTFPVGQRERLTVRLKNLIRQYQRGPGIIKEFIQNADDAGSDWVRVVMDWRDHRTGLPGEEDLADVLGPALLIANGAVFSDSNFDAIQKIGEGDKQLSAAKTGRFGLGFNTAYNVTDYPSFVSRDRMLCFDPHEGPVAQQGHTGLGLRLGALRRRFPSWHAAFGAGDLDSRADSHPGTIFRLPLRSPERAARSEISKEPFDAAAFRAIVKKLAAEGPAMLLFTRNVLHLCVEEIPKRGGPTRAVLNIRTKNVGEVTSSRKSIQVAPDVGSSELLTQLEAEGIRSTSHRHRMTVSTTRGSASTEWHVCQGFYPDSEGELMRCAHKMLEFGERAIPDVGVAVALHRSAEGALVASNCQGLYCCGLPLPTQTGLPVHINGCFDLDDSRTKPTMADATSESGRTRADWNRSLLRLAVAQCYADALVSLPDEVKEADADAFYKLWPPAPSSVSDEGIARAVLAIHTELAGRPIYRCTTSGGVGWLTLPELDVMPVDVESTLIQALLAQDYCIPEPALPRSIIESARDADLEIYLVTPQSVREDFVVESHADCELEQAPFPAFRKREWLEAITRFVLREKPVDLRGLPLCLLANGKLVAFGHAQGAKTFIATPEERYIFQGYPHWFIDEEFRQATGLEAQPSAKFEVMTAKAVLLNLNRPLPKLQDAASIAWNPTDANAPNEDWLTAVLEYFAESDLEIARDEIEDFPLVPDQRSCLHRFYHEQTPLIPPSAKKLDAALRGLGLPLLSGPPALVKAVLRFNAKLPGAGIWDAKELDLIDCLYAWREEWESRFVNYEPSVHAPMLDVLSEETCIERLDEDSLGKLKALRILPTDDGRVVDVNEPDFYLPAGEQPPAVVGPIHLALLGRREKWRPLLEAIGVKPLDLPMLIGGVLLPGFEKLEAEQQLDVLKFIRSNIDRAVEQEATAGGPRTLKRDIGTAKIVRGTDGGLHAADSMFSPKLQKIASVLGANAVFPDIDTYPEPRDAWRDLFHAIGLKTQITSVDLIRRIDNVTSGDATPMERRQIGAVFEYIQKHWQELKAQPIPIAAPAGTESLAEALKRRKWLPAASEASFPGFEVPKVQWFRPSELYPLGRGHLVAGEAPLLAGQNPTTEVLTALGIPQWPGLDLVLRRFDRLITLVASPANANLKTDDVRKSFEEIYRFLGRTAPSASRAGANFAIRYAGRHCIWDHQRHRLIRPCDAFQENVRFFEPHKVRIVADPQISAGLDALGRRTAVEAADYRDFLDLLSRHTASSPCTPEEQDQALRALNELGRPENAEHVDDDLPVLTQTGKLIPLSDVIFRDRPVLAQRVTGTSVEFAHNSISGRTIIEKLRRLSEAVTVILAEEPMLSNDAQLRALCRRLESRIRSPEFFRAVRRLVNHERGYPVLEFTPPLERVEVRPAITIYTTLLLADNEGERVVGGGEVDFFVDRALARIWIATRKAGAVLPKLVPAINEFMDTYRLNDTLPLAAILDDRDSIETALENYEIPPLMEEWRPAADWRELGTLGDAASEEAKRPDQVSEDDTFAADTTELHQQLDEEPVSDTHGDLGEEEGPAAGGLRQTATEGRAVHGGLPPSSASRRSQNGRQPARGAEALRGRGLPSGSDDAPPIAPGTDRSRGKGEKQTADHQDNSVSTAQAPRSIREQPSRSRRRGRFYSYVNPPSSDGSDEGGARSDEANTMTEELEIGRAAVALVLADELLAGRAPRQMSHTNPGYDIEATDSAGDVRYIEVKGIDGPWNEVGVSLSTTQFRLAMEKAGAAWLYVVEHARDPGRSRIHRIQDPANTVTDFCFDVGWQAVGSTETGGVSPPGVGDEYLLDDGEIVTVVGIDAGVAFTRLRVRSLAGDERFVLWRLHRSKFTASAI